MTTKNRYNIQEILDTQQTMYRDDQPRPQTLVDRIERLTSEVDELNNRVNAIELVLTRLADLVGFEPNV